VVGKTFPLEDATEAYRTMESRDFFGKLVLQTP
jgi:NADPH:quinone reductase-like Zn-dependent oxidoreductase